MLNVLILLFHLTALAVLTALTYRLWRNLRFLRWANSTTVSQHTPSVSVLIPARDEAANSAPCVESLMQSSYPHYDVTVLDDQSTDGTGEQLTKLAAQYPALRVIHGTESPPEGWNGKSYACHCLAAQACGEWLLFTDADTIHTPDSVGRGVAHAQMMGVDFLSVFPYQRTETWAERLMVPFVIGFLPLVGFDLNDLWEGKTSQLAANGQYILVRASTYQHLGGHAAISGARVDDFALVRLFAEAGHRVALVDGRAMLSCRMYYNAREVWNGFSKNILLALSEGTDKPQPLWKNMLFAWGYGSLFIMPYVLLFAPAAPLALLVIGWLWGLRAMVSVVSGHSIWEAPTVSLSALGVMLISLNATWMRWRGRGVAWKGRIYR